MKKIHEQNNLTLCVILPKIRNLINDWIDKITPWKTKTLYKVNYSIMDGNYAKKWLSELGNVQSSPYTIFIYKNNNKANDYSTENKPQWRWWWLKWTANIFDNFFRIASTLYMHVKKEIITSFCRWAVNTKHAVSLNVEIKPTDIIEIMQLWL